MQLQLQTLSWEDTGVRGTHEALKGNWRSDHGWYDPYTNTTTPNDNNGHGTHTMGIIAGKFGIGVAPGAKWIACRGCGNDSCDSANLLFCGQWMLKPTNPNGSDPDPKKIPDVVSNSWGSNVGGNSWYNATIEAWRAAGILHTFAFGNSGPACKSRRSPGDQPTTFGVGSTDKDGRLSIFSSKGTAGTALLGTYIKPDIAAPGSNVTSAWNTGDMNYAILSGTSMASPHLAGAIALMISANRPKTGNKSAIIAFDIMVKTIEKTADTKNLTVPLPNTRCEGVLSPVKYPNNQFGYGRVNALGAVTATMNGLHEEQHISFN